ncbi:MAG: hypothetical protein ACK5HP_01795 [Bacilli bacterium]
MNILEELNKKGVTLNIRYCGADDMLTGFMAKELLENQDDILKHYQHNKIDNVNEYIDYIFLEILMKFFEIVPLIIIEEKRESFKQFLDKCKIVYDKYIKKDVIFFIKNHYLDIYSYKDNEDSSLFLELDLKDYTSIFIGMNFNSFSITIIDYVITIATFDVIDSFEIWGKYFYKNPNQLNNLFNEENIKKVFNMRFSEVSDILEALKPNKKFSTIISNTIDIIYGIVKENYFNPKDDTGIWQSYYMLNDTLVFLKKMNSTYIYELEKELYQIEIKFNENLMKTGYTSTFEYNLKPFVEFFENKTSPWEVRIVYLTHFQDKEGNLCSFLEHGAKSNIKALSDEIARKNPGTDDYFTSWRLRNLSLQIFEIKARIMSIFQKKENVSEYISDIYGELKYICENNNTTMELEELTDNVEMLSQYLADLFINLSTEKSTEMTIKNTIYGCSIFVCSLIEKVLRIIYKNSLREILYIPDSGITLGTLLKEEDKNNSIIIDILGKEQIKCLRYFLHKTENGIGDNIRNDLAHLNGRTPRRLNYDLITELLSYLSSILNSCVLYYQRQTNNKSKELDSIENS